MVPICRSITVFDNGSDDKSKQIAEQYDNVVWDVETYGDKFNDVKKMKVSNIWIDASSDADLVYIGDIDEILYHPSGLKSYYKNRIKR